MRSGHMSRGVGSGEEMSSVPTLERIGPQEWRLLESAWEVSERFYTGCELWEAGQTPAALAIFQDLLQHQCEVKTHVAHLGTIESSLT
jgi:hypothetical protein